MSDPVSNADIEDVLSSIRRLVSDEPNADAGARAEPAQPSVERFVLTPAFRVEDAQEAEHAEVDLANLDDSADDAGDPDTGETQNVHPFVATAAEDTDAHSDHEASDPAAHGGVSGDELDSQISEEYQSDEEWSDENLEADSEPHPHDPAPDIEAESHVVHEDAFVTEETQSPDDLTLEERIAGLEAAIELAPQEWEPDGSETDETDETTPISLNLVNPDDAALEDAIDFAAPESDTDDTEASEAPDHSGEEGETHSEAATDDLVSEMVAAEIDFNLNEKAEEASEFEAAEPDAEDTADSFEDTASEWSEPEPEPDDVVEAVLSEVDASHDDPSGALHDWEETPMRDVTPDETDEAGPADNAASLGATSGEDDDDEDGGNFLSDEADLLDEESLRAMVSDLVREELQGVLGERITRNVRRLVRREIQRALTMRDLD